jgi:hypothetical protein
LCEHPHTVPRPTRTTRDRSPPRRVTRLTLSTGAPRSVLRWPLRIVRRDAPRVASRAIRCARLDRLPVHPRNGWPRCRRAAAAGCESGQRLIAKGTAARTPVSPASATGIGPVVLVISIVSALAALTGATATARCRSGGSLPRSSPSTT